MTDPAPSGATGGKIKSAGGTGPVWPREKSPTRGLGLAPRLCSSLPRSSGADAPGRRPEGDTAQPVRNTTPRARPGRRARTP